MISVIPNISTIEYVSIKKVSFRIRKSNLLLSFFYQFLCHHAAGSCNSGYVYAFAQ